MQRELRRGVYLYLSGYRLSGSMQFNAGVYSYMYSRGLYKFN